jgi:hypothetical protein
VSAGLVCVERTLLSAAFDSSPERREWSRSSRTGQQPDAKSREFIPQFGDATQPKSPALRFAIGRATPAARIEGPGSLILFVGYNWRASEALTLGCGNVSHLRH